MKAGRDAHRPARQRQTGTARQHDTIVDYVHSEELVRGLKKRSVEHEFILLDGIGHTFDWETGNRQPLPRDLRPVALTFLEKHLTPVAGH